MHSIGIRRASFLVAIAAAFSLLAAPALGDERPWEQARWNALEARPATAGLDLAVDPRWAVFPIDVDAARESARDARWELRLGRNVALSIQAPPVEEWAPGLAFEIRF